MKKIMLFVVIVICMSGCNRIPLPSSSSVYVQPQGKVIVGNKDYRMVIGEFEWKEVDFEARKVSDSDVCELADQFPTIEVVEENKLTLDIEQGPSSIMVNQWDEDGTIVETELLDNEIILPEDAGYYIFELIAEWNEGEITYVFDVDIK